MQILDLLLFALPIGWIIACLDAFRIGLRDKTYGMPFVSVALNTMWVLIGGTWYIVSMGFRSFALRGTQRLSLQSRGDGQGEFLISTELGGRPIGRIAVDPSKAWRADAEELAFPTGDAAIYLTYHGKGGKELLSIAF